MVCDEEQREKKNTKLKPREQGASNLRHQLHCGYGSCIQNGVVHSIIGLCVLHWRNLEIIFPSCQWDRLLFLTLCPHRLTYMQLWTLICSLAPEAALVSRCVGVSPLMWLQFFDRRWKLSLRVALIATIFIKNPIHFICLLGTCTWTLNQNMCHKCERCDAGFWHNFAMSTCTPSHHNTTQKRNRIVPLTLVTPTKGLPGQLSHLNLSYTCVCV